MVVLRVFPAASPSLSGLQPLSSDILQQSSTMPSPGPSTAPLLSYLPKHNSAHSTSLTQKPTMAPLAYKMATTSACHSRLATMKLTCPSCCHLTVLPYFRLFTYILLSLTSGVSIQRKMSSISKNQLKFSLLSTAFSNSSRLQWPLPFSFLCCTSYILLFGDSSVDLFPN